MPVMTILPPREGYAPHSAGAISLLVSRLASPDDLIVGSPLDEAPLQGGHYLPVPPVFGGARWLSDNYRYTLGVKSLVRKHRPALIEVHNKPAMAARLARLAPVHLILHNDPQDMRGAHTPRQREALLGRLRVITVSDWLRRRYLEDLDEAPVAVMPNCLDLDTLPPRPPERAPVVLFVGRIVADKGVDAFVRAWGAISSLVPGWQAMLIGADRFRADAPRTVFVDRVEAQADTVGIAHLGYQPHGAVLEAMARVAIVVVPSRWPEPFGLTALEAMASGAAVIAAPHGGLPEVVGDAALFARPDPPGELEAALLQLIGNDSLRAEMVAKGLARARLFDVPLARDRLAALRAETLEAAGRHG